MSTTALPQASPRPPRVAAVGRIRAGEWGGQVALPDLEPDPYVAARRLWIAARAQRYLAHPPATLRAWWAREVPERAHLAATLHPQEAAECLAVLDYSVDHLTDAADRREVRYAAYRARMDQL